MAELDYAFLADYATVQDGKLTAVGASFVQLRAPLPFVRAVTVAGRIRTPQDGPDIELSAEFVAPGDSPVFRSSTTLTHAVSSQRYADKVGILFVVTQQLRFTEPGLCAVKLRLDGEDVRTLKFEVEGA